MRFSHQWLQELSKVKMQPEKMAEVLSLHSFETEVASPPSPKGFGRASSDTLLEVDILPNRAIDGYSHVSVARELAVIKGKKLNLPKTQLKEDKKLNARDVVNVVVRDTKLCPRYAARVIDGVKVKGSPLWLKRRLQSLGLNSINNIVDATNYVMLEIGQPLHAFDADKIVEAKGKRQIIVRQAKRQERVTTLDGQRLELPKGVLLITDPKKILAIAGIKGATGSEITAKTKTIILEAANFNSSSIRQSSKLLGLKTDASTRFSQNLSPDLVPLALDRVAELIKKLAGGTVYQGRVDVYPHKLKPQKLFVDLERAENLLGQRVKSSEAASILGRLGFELEKIDLYKQVGQVVELAKQLVGKKYKYGASTTFDAPEQFDCSSFVKYLYRQIGFELPRVSIEQAEIGKKVPLNKLQAGDLVFTNGSKAHFSDKFKKGIGHVAMYIGNGKVIHASGRGTRKGVLVSPLKKIASKKDFRVARRPVSEEYDRDGLLVTVPTMRLNFEQTSVWQEADVVEEIGRIMGLEKIKPVLPAHQAVPATVPEDLKWQEMLRTILAGLGFSEVYNYGLIGEKDKTVFSLNQRDLVVLANPLSEEVKYLRPSLLPSLLKNVQTNQRFFNEFKLFEIGKRFGWAIKKPPFMRSEKGGFRTGDEHEKTMICGVAVSSRSGQELFYELKGVLDVVFEKVGLVDLWHDEAKATPEDSKIKWWAKNQTAEVKSGNKEIGFLGVIDQQLLRNLDVKLNVAAFEIDFEKMIELAQADKRYRELPKFPAVTRDLSIMTQEGVKIDEMLNVVELAGGPLLADTDVIDIYEGGKEMPQGQQSVTFRLIFQSDERTLTDSEVNKLMEKIQSAVKKQGWQVR